MHSIRVSLTDVVRSDTLFFFASVTPSFAALIFLFLFSTFACFVQGPVDVPVDMVVASEINPAQTQGAYPHHQVSIVVSPKLFSTHLLRWRCIIIVNVKPVENVMSTNCHPHLLLETEFMRLASVKHIMQTSLLRSSDSALFTGTHMAKKRNILYFQALCFQA